MPAGLHQSLLQQETARKLKKNFSKNSKNTFLKYARHCDALKYINNIMWLEMRSAVLTSFASKFITCVEGCHGDRFAISADRHQRRALKCINPYCDMLSHQYPQITAHNLIFSNHMVVTVLLRVCVCVLLVCLPHSLIFTIRLETRKRPVIPQHFVT